MRKSIAVVALLAAGAAWGADKPLPVLVKNPSVTVQAADAGQYAHVGQKPSRIVNFQIFTGSSRRIDPVTAESISESYQVPDGFVLVLTDIQVFSNCAPGEPVAYTLRHSTSVLESPRDLIRDICPATGEVSLNRHYSTGMLFGAGSEFFITTNSFTNNLMYGQGYLVPAD